MSGRPFYAMFSTIVDYENSGNLFTLYFEGKSTSKHTSSDIERVCSSVLNGRGRTVGLDDDTLGGLDLGGLVG